MKEEADWQGRPIAPSQLQILSSDDPWNRSYGPTFGPRPPRGMGRSFENYLASRLTIPTGSVQEVQDFLRRCLYARDPDVYGRREIWIHPEDFERSRVGDCEDHALWAWVHLVRLGLDARFTAGRHDGGGHAWVTVYREGKAHVCETTAKNDGVFFQPVQGCPDYVPLWSVGGGPTFFWHGAMPEESPGIVFLDGA